MPRYYFDIVDRDGVHCDEFGDDLNDLQEACEQAQAILADVVRGELPDGDLHIVTCDVRDESDRVVYRGRITYQGTRDPEVPAESDDRRQDRST